MRTVDDAGLVQVEGSYYAALPAPLYSEVTVRISARDRDPGCRGHRCCAGTRKPRGRARFVIAKPDRIFNPSRETVRLLARVGEDRAAHRGAGPGTVHPPRPSRPAGALRPRQPAAHLPPRRHRSGLRAAARRRVLLVPAVKAALERQAAATRRRRAADAGGPRDPAHRASTRRSGRHTPRDLTGGDDANDHVDTELEQRCAGCACRA